MPPAKAGLAEEGLKLVASSGALLWPLARGHDRGWGGAFWSGERGSPARVCLFPFGRPTRVPTPPTLGPGGSGLQSLEGRHSLPGPSEPSPALPGHVSIVRGPFGRPCPLAPPPRCCFAAECCQGVSGDVGSHRSVATLWPGHTWPCAGMWQPPWKGALAAVCTSQHSHWKKYFKTPCSFFAPCPGRVLTVFLPRGLPVPRPSALCPAWRGFAAGGQRVSPSWA